MSNIRLKFVKKWPRFINFLATTPKSDKLHRYLGQFIKAGRYSHIGILVSDTVEKILHFKLDPNRINKLQSELRASAAWLAIVEVLNENALRTIRTRLPALISFW